MFWIKKLLIELFELRLGKINLLEREDFGGKSGMRQWLGIFKILLKSFVQEDYVSQEQ